MRFSRPLAHTLVAVAAAASLTAGVAPATHAGPMLAGPPKLTGADLKFDHPGTTLRPGKPAQAGLDPAAVARLAPDVASFMTADPAANRPNPLYPGAVVLAARRGVVVTHQAMGQAVRYEKLTGDTPAKPVELPRDKWVDTRTDTIYDMASVSKLFTTIVAMRLQEQGRIELDAPVARYIPAYAQNGKDRITIRHLLTHTSGLRSGLPLWRDWHDVEARYAAVYADTPINPLGTKYLYSDLNLIALGRVAETVSGKRLDRLVSEIITGPLAMADTGYNPPKEKLDRIAATEWQPWTRGQLIRGTVHDENCLSLGGVSGHAGIFSTAGDTAVLAQTLLNGGRYDRYRMLREPTVRLLFTNFNTHLPDEDHSLGFDLNQRWYMGAMSSPVSAGHTGYTGTSLVLDPVANSFLVLLTNRVHPSRDWGSINPARVTAARDLALAVPVRSAGPRPAWFSGIGNNRDVSLGLPIQLAQGGRARFALWFDTESSAAEGQDAAVLEAQTAAGWKPVSTRLRTGRYDWTVPGTFAGWSGRRWLTADAQLPAGTTALRWRYTTDVGDESRGVHVDQVRVHDKAGKVVFDDRRRADAGRYQAGGWVRSAS